VSLAFLVPFSLGVASSIFCSYLYRLMKTEVNRKLREADHVGEAGYPGKLFELELLHRRLYPSSRRRLVLNAMVAVSVLAFILSAIAIG